MERRTQLRGGGYTFGRNDGDQASTSELNSGEQQYEKGNAPWYKVKAWRKRTWAIITCVLVAIIVIVISVAVTQVQKYRNRYPNYFKVNYVLKDTYLPQNFFERFDYFHDIDPVNGFVHYADPTYAARYNLTGSSPTSAWLKVDTKLGVGSTPDDASTGRLSARVFSKTTYDKGLFIFDIKHTPFGCGVWPALWLVDASNWPDHGEIDIMEALNLASSNTMSLHTTSGCNMAIRRLMTGNAIQPDCHNTTNGNQGCRVDGPTTSIGQDFSIRGGALMALEWRAEGIRLWQFDRSRLPGDLLAQRPDPSTWGTTLADFPSTECDISAHFKNASITANIDLCGTAMDKGVYEASGCPANCVGSHKCIGSDATRNNCTDFVANFPGAFSQAYWEFGTFQVYQAA